MTRALGHLVVRRRVSVLVLSALVLVAAIALLVRGGTLTSGTIEGIESTVAMRRMEEALGRPGLSSFTIVFRSATLEARGAPFREAMQAALAPLAGDPRVHTIEAPHLAPGPLAERYYGRDGRSAIAKVGLRSPYTQAMREYPEVRAKVRLPEGSAGRVEMLFTGHLAFMTDLDARLQRDLIEAEIISVPLALLVLIFVFGSLTAAALPVGTGGIAVLGAIAGITALSRRMEIAQYAINFVSLVGLGVAIDYSLFIVSRYRDELARGLSTEDAIAEAVATAGKAVVGSGIAVAIGLAGLLFFRGSYLEGIGIGGALVVLLSILFALTFLPALLAVLGPRIDRWRFPALRWSGDGVWRAIAHRVMERPVLFLVPGLVLLGCAALPFLRLRMAAADITCLPLPAEARRGHEVLRELFPDDVATRMALVVTFPSAPALTRERVPALVDLSRRAARLPGVSRMESIFDLPGDMEREDYADLLGVSRTAWPETLRPFIEAVTGERTVVLSALSAHAPSSEEARAIVRELRRERAVLDGELLVTGQTANDVDSTDYLLGHTPMAVGFVLGMTALVLFFLLGSYVLPLKAIVMNLLSIGASFGALVWIFQDGHLAGALGFTPGPIEPTLPTLLFCTVFGLSMDYEVLLLSRMREEWLRTGDNARAVAEGLERSGRLITSAAAIMVAVFGAFALASVIMVKAMGLGLAIAVALDATIVRTLVVPSTMRLFGDWNWWGPKWMRGAAGAGAKDATPPTEAGAKSATPPAEAGAGGE